MATINFLVEWETAWEPPQGPKLLSRVLTNLDKRIFTSGFLDRFWNKVARDIGRAVAEKFETKPGWPPLKPRYRKWKVSAVAHGWKVKVGAFGKKVAKFTEMGKLTGIMYESATRKRRWANIFEIRDEPHFRKAHFKYAIDLTKLPYARKFDTIRPFFYLTAEEANKVMKNLHLICWREMRKVIKQQMGV